MRQYCKTTLEFSFRILVHMEFGFLESQKGLTLVLRRSAVDVAILNGGLIVL